MSRRAFAVELEPQPHECADCLSGGLAPQTYGDGEYAASFRLAHNELTPMMAQHRQDRPVVHAGEAAQYDSDVSELDIGASDGVAAPSDTDVIKRLFGSVFRA